jgi:hypothetical protein
MQGKGFYYWEVDTASTGHQWRDEGEYASWGCENSIIPLSLKRVTANEFYDVVTTFGANRGDKLYLVWLTYSEGDSFGRETGKVEYLALYENIADAILVTREFRRKFNGKQHFVDIKLTSGYNERINTEFLTEYFTNFEDIDYKELIVT